jgi:anion-transporting  ArsA/GET3 family ATPase
VTGKGGVGKSTVCAAIAVAAARRGARTLAIETPERAGLCRILGASPAGPGATTPVAPNLTVSYFDGAAALSEYLARILRLRPLLGSILEHPLYRAFVHAAPGVQDLMAVGKVRDELRRQRRGHRCWDVIVLDAGATGHSLQLLRMPAAAAGAFDGGLVHREAARIDAMLRDPETCAVHLVATPEQMPLDEAAQAIAVVRDELAMPLGAIFVNQCRATAPRDIDAAIDVLGRLPLGAEHHAARDALRAAMLRARGWERIQEAGIGAFQDRTGLPLTRLPRLLPAPERSHADDLANFVAEAVL